MMWQADMPPEINREGFIFHHREGRDHECNMNAGDVLPVRLQTLKSLCTMKHEEVGTREAGRPACTVRAVLGVPSASQALILPRPRTMSAGHKAHYSGVIVFLNHLGLLIDYC